MRTVKLAFILFLLGGLAQFSVAQSSVPAGIVSAIKSGDANKLSAYFSDNLQLAVGNKNDIYSKQQSVGIISDFFKSNQVINFNIIHQASSRDAANFVIGTLATNKGKYRVSILIRRSGNNSIIQQLRIEPGND